MRRLLPLLALGLGAAVTFSACGDGIGGGYAAKVNGNVLKMSDLNEELRQIRDNKDYQDAIAQGGTPVVGKGGKDTFNSAFVAQVVNQDVLLQLVHQELARRHIAVTEADIQQASDSVNQSFTNQQGDSILKKFSKWYQDRLIRRQAEVAVLEKAVGNTDTSDAAVQQYYDQHKDQYSETCVRHILVATKPEADAVRAQLAGGADFATVAKQKSTDTGSAEQGGDLGCDISGFVQEFQQAASTLPVNDISQPVQSQFGYHIIQVTKRDTKPLDDATKQQIQQTLQQAGGQQLTNLVFGLLDKSKVQVTPSIGPFRKGDPAKGESSSVVPNGAPTETTTPAAPAASDQTPTTTT